MGKKSKKKKEDKELDEVMKELKQPTIELSVQDTDDPNKLVDLTSEGSLVNIPVNTGYNEFGMVLKYIMNISLKNKVPELDVDSDFIVLGTYHLAEVAENANIRPNERPTLYLLPARIVSDNYTVLVPHDDAIKGNGLKQKVIDAMKELAVRDESVNDRVNELLRLSIMSCLNRSFASSTNYEEAVKQMQGFMTDEELKDLEDTAVVVDDETA